MSASCSYEKKLGKTRGKYSPKLKDNFTDEESDFDDGDDDEWSGAEDVINSCTGKTDYGDSESDGYNDSDSHNETNKDDYEDDNNFYISQDKKTVWKKQSTKIKRENNVDKSKESEKVDDKLLMSSDFKVLPLPNTDVHKTFDEVSSFQEMLDDEIFQKIVNHTNAYLSKKKSASTFGRDRDCKLTSFSEMQALIGMLYLIGVKKGNHTNVDELWTKDGTGMPILRASMSAKRFLFLLQAIRFDDKDTRDERMKSDNLAPIREVLDSFVNNCKKKHEVGEFITIGEKLEPFKGKCSFIHYIPNRPRRYGIKIIALCDSQTHFTCNLEVHSGKQLKGNYSVSDEQYDTVHRLVDHLKGTNRNLTMSNRYTSVPLATSLLESKITLLGAIRQNNKEILPLQFRPNKKRPVGSTLFGFLEDITVASYVPRQHKCLSLLSTMHCDEIDEETKKPLMILDYYQTKGGVDTMDKLCTSYTVSRITRRWPLALFYAILNIAGINAFVIYRSNISNSKYRRSYFLKNLALKLMRPLLEERSKLKNLPKDIQIFLAPYEMKADIQLETYEDHKSIRKSDTEDEPKIGNKRRKRGRCVICGRKKDRTTNMTCSKCGIYVCRDHCIAVTTCISCANESKMEVLIDYESE